MSLALVLTVFVLGIFFSAVYSGSETGLYSVSRVRIELEARRGRLSSRLLHGFLQRDASVLITILIGNNLMLEIVTWTSEYQLRDWGFSGHERELCLTLGLTPIVFFLGEALPKDLFRRRPHRLMAQTAPLIAASAVVFWPLERILRLVALSIERLAGFSRGGLIRRPGRAQLLLFLREGTRSGVLDSQAEDLARNALALRGIPVSTAMVPWSEVRALDAEAGEEALLRGVRESAHTRLLVVRAGVVEGYLHQLEVLAAEEGTPVLASLRPIPHLDPASSVDRALGRLRTVGGRAAVVGSPERPLGLVTLKDLLEEISGDLGGW